jgi:hypothetical protein
MHYVSKVLLLNGFCNGVRVLTMFVTSYQFIFKKITKTSRNPVTMPTTAHYVKTYALSPCP